MEITAKSVKRFFKSGRNRLIFLYWLLMFFAGAAIVIYMTVFERRIAW